MVFVFDLDDTICDTDGYSEKYIFRFFEEHKLPLKQIATNVRFAESKFDWDHETALCWYKTHGDKMMAEFPLKDGAKEFLDLLHTSGHKIVIATARATDWHTKPEETTLEWLKKNNIPYDQIFMGRIDKEKICEEVGADFFIDDDISITDKVSKHSSPANTQVFLMTSNFNRDLDIPENVQRVDGFEELEKYIISK